MTENEKLAAEYHENKNMIRELEKANERIKKQLISCMKKDVEFFGSYQVCYKLVYSNSFDSKAMKEKHPALWADFMTVKQYRKFEVK